MNERKTTLAFLAACLVTFVICGTSNLSAKDKQADVKGAKKIEAAAGITESHPEIEEGVTCVDCHDIKLDANTTATQVWLSGDYANFTAHEGVLTNDKVRQAITEVMGGKKQSKTCVLATCINNTPLSTTAEFTLDQDKMTLHGIHEKGTAKLFHIQQNPRVSINWHREYESFTKILCIQFIGTAELIDGSDPEFEKILMEVIPYEDQANARNIPLDKCRAMFKQMMVMSRITIKEATITNSVFRRQGGYRPWQRWTRNDPVKK